MSEKPITLPLWVRDQFAKLACANLEKKGLRKPPGFDPTKILDTKIKSGDNEFMTKFKKLLHAMCDEYYRDSLTPGDLQGEDVAGNPWNPMLPHEVMNEMSYFFGPDGLLKKSGVKDADQRFKSAVGSLSNLYLEMFENISKDDMRHKSKAKLAAELGRNATKEDTKENMKKALAAQYARIITTFLVMHSLRMVFGNQQGQISEILMSLGVTPDGARMNDEKYAQMKPMAVRVAVAREINRVLSGALAGLEKSKRVTSLEMLKDAMNDLRIKPEKAAPKEISEQEELFK